MMVASKRHKELFWFRPEPYVQSQRRSSACSSVECSEVLTMGYARRVKIGKRMERDCPNKGFKSLSPWKGALAALI
jgi:hypothetical protein